MRDSRTVMQVADRLVAWNMIDRAAEVLERYLLRYPADPDALRRLGRVRLAQGRAGDAVPLLEQAVAHDRMMLPLRRAGTLEPQPQLPASPASSK